MQVVSTRAELARALADIKGKEGGAGTVGLVPTMGALHSGHEALMRTARADCDVVVVSDFVNPLQFTDLGDCDDYRLYPRDLEGDADVCRRAGVDILFAPSVEEMYPSGVPAVWVRAGELGEVYEGASRPGHFDGVATVVSILFHLVGPDRAYFGQKDAQQVVVLRRMVADLHFPVEIVAVPIQRTEEGLAESSRNQRLSAQGRGDALALSRALQEVETRPVDEVRAELAAAPGVVLDYFEMVDPASMRPLQDEAQRPALAIIAAEVEGVRLLDNAIIGITTVKDSASTSARTQQ